MTPRLPGPSVRVKLTLSYAVFLLIAGLALFAVGALLLRFVPEGNLTLLEGGWVPDRSDLMDVFVRCAGWALALLVVIGLAGGWFLAGWMLAPIDRIAKVVQRAGDAGFDDRVNLPGRRDELTDLADAFDGMLDRVQHTIEEERRFAANASHELRTPHAIIRTMVEVAQADPEGRDIDLVLQRIAATNERAIASTEALLLLARAGRGDVAKEAVDLATLVAEVLDDVREGSRGAGTVHIEEALHAASAYGNRGLLTRAVANLVQNALVHNLPEGGQLAVSTDTAPGGAAVLTVSNTGPVIDPAVAQTLTEPFVRGAGRARPTGEEGAGLGLAIVASVVRTHGGQLQITALREGGLQVRMTLPRGAV
ncbi:HAMP domain-containing sensor histidine kinase [Microbacterium sp. zg-YB36]|uniref:sensor histidine kinase n=1 Tax=Microbacterium sp. zg-YB36 TaxID=2969407 RepID=UPI00214B0266|nr:HAMP domain-containing sensor histidine kinase [Microbacterium sp. zg-YB36]MDL5351285.1 HAMP domain-containing sensor histidine kinase [Microbacterium sp. zg-YB36]